MTVYNMTVDATIAEMTVYMMTVDEAIAEITVYKMTVDMVNAYEVPYSEHFIFFGTYAWAR
jgi:hypothetical protein